MLRVKSKGISIICASFYKKKYNKIIYYKDYAEIIIISKVYGIKKVKIDLEDVEKINKYSWYLLVDKKCNIFYSRAMINNKFYLLHRYIMNCPKDKVIDHINHNGLDNRKKKLKNLYHF